MISAAAGFGHDPTRYTANTTKNTTHNNAPSTMGGATSVDADQNHF